MPRKSHIHHSTTIMQPAESKAPRRHTYASKTNNKTKSSLDDVFAFSMHANDPSSAFLDECLASPTPDDMYLDSFHGDDIPSLSLDADDCSDGPKSFNRINKKTKKKKKRKNKSFNTKSDESSDKMTSTKSKSKSFRSSKSKKTKAAEDKNVTAMLKKLEDYEESLQEEWYLLQKERASITAEREALQLKMFELKSKSDELEDNDRSMLEPSCSHNTDDEEALRVENEILQRRLQRQDEIILQLSNSDEKVEHTNEISRLEEELRRAKEINAKNEKIIKGHELTIERMQKEASGNGSRGGAHTLSHNATDDVTSPVIPISIVGTHNIKDRDDDVTASFSSLSNLDDSFSSLRVTKLKPSHNGEKDSPSRSFGRVKSWVKYTRSNPRSRIKTSEEVAL